MGNEGYWQLFWQTGRPEAWLLGRREEQPEAVAECVSDGPVADAKAHSGINAHA